jgi:hypothetical protein
MTAVFAARRRAEEFAALLEHPGTAPAGRSDRLVELAGLVEALRATPPVEARPAFVRDLRAELMAAADALPTPATAPALDAQTARLTLPPAQRRRDRRVAALVGGLALVGATTSVAVAAQGALPGEALYPVKRAIETFQTDLRSGERDKGQLLLANAADRLGEVSALSNGAEQPDAPAVAGALDAFSAQAREGSRLLLADYAAHGREASVAQLRDFDATSLRQLTELEPVVPAAARDRLMNAARVLFEIDATAQRTCPGCGGTGIHEIPGVFAPVASGTAPAVVSSSTLQPLARPQDPASTRPAPRPGRGTAHGGTTRPGGGSGTAAGAGLPTGAGTPSSPAGDPIGTLIAPVTGPLTGPLTASPSGSPGGSLTDPLTGPLTSGTTSPSSDPLPGTVGDLLQPAGDAVKDATKDPTGTGLSDPVPGVSDSPLP